MLPYGTTFSEQWYNKSICRGVRIFQIANLFNLEKSTLTDWYSLCVCKREFSYGRTTKEILRGKKKKERFSNVFICMLWDLPWFFQNWLPQSSAQLVSPVRKHLLLFAAHLPSCFLWKLVQTSSHLFLCQHKKNIQNKEWSNDHVHISQEKKSISMY